MKRCLHARLVASQLFIWYFADRTYLLTCRTTLGFTLFALEPTFRNGARASARVCRHLPDGIELTVGRVCALDAAPPRLGAKSALRMGLQTRLCHIEERPRDVQDIPSIGDIDISINEFVHDVSRSNALVVATI
jgi:hypothetical protein